MILALTFVHVFFSSFSWPVSFVGPCGYVAYVTLANSVEIVAQGHWEGLAIEAVNGFELAFYAGIFYLCARFTFRCSKGIPAPTIKLIFQFLVLSVVFSCSFLRVIQGSSFVNWTGAYDFWGGCARFWATR
jgi:hypothetical protein